MPHNFCSMSVNNMPNFKKPLFFQKKNPSKSLVTCNGKDSLPHN